ncbi:MAG: DUF2065 domain-containing protein [Pseudomonadales bacterium]|nr:DUF2065 domain-containing protein [Pseudomonadales bacterium]
MWHDLAIAFCLMLVIEGLTPFLSPRAWRAMIAAAEQLDDRSLRLAGLGSMLAGTLLLYMVN